MNTKKMLFFTLSPKNKFLRVLKILLDPFPDTIYPEILRSASVKINTTGFVLLLNFLC